MTSGFLPPHGGYKNLLSYQKSDIVYQGTVYFCDRFLNPRDRTRDQMIQAAHSGKQNIVEGSMASGTSKEMEIKLTNVARASLEELLEDYKDYMQTNGIELWPSDDPKVTRLRELNRIPEATYETFQKGIENSDPAVCANVMYGIVKVTTYLLDQQIRSLEKAFLKEGGIRERMTQARLNARDQQRRDANERS